MDDEKQNITITPEGMEAARLYCQWYLGDSSWANDIMRRAQNPELTRQHLIADGMEL